MGKLCSIPQNRDGRLDALKGIFIFLVVFGHLIRGETSASNNLYGVMHYYIYSIHMPVFIFISGLLSKKRFEYKSIVSSLVLPYLIINIPIIITRIILNRFEIIDLITPWEITWYVLTLAFCRLISNINTRCQRWIVLAMVILTLAGTKVSAPVWGVLSLGRTALLYPVFYFGKHIDLNKIKRFPLVYGWLLFVGCIVIQSMILIYNIVPITWATHDYTDSIVNIAIKYLLFLSAVMATLGIYIIIPQKLCLLQKWEKNSMVVYFFHIFLCYAVQHFIPVFKVEYLFAVIMLSIMITMILSLERFNIIYTQLMGKVSKVLRLS